MAGPVCSFWGCGIVCTFAFACLQYDIITVAIRMCIYTVSRQSVRGRRVFQAAISRTRTNLLPTALYKHTTLLAISLIEKKFTYV